MIDTMIDFPTSYQWIQGELLIIPFGYIMLGNTAVGTYSIRDEEEYQGFLEMNNNRGPHGR